MAQPDHTKEALAKIIAAAESASENLRPALGQRHYVAGMGGEVGLHNDLYWTILQAERALLVLTEQAKKELSK